MKPRRRYVVRSPLAPPTEVPGQRELLAVREVVHAFLHADRPEEAFQFALDRVGPVVGASLASVYLIDGASELMRLAAAHNWPERHRPWLAEARVRIGFGPSGESASERRVIEVPDVFADADLEDWQDVARELGFSAIVSLPIQSATEVRGAVTFYFKAWDDFTPERRGLLRLVADLMAGAADRAQLLDRLRRAEAAATDAHGELDRQFLAAREAKRARVEFERAAADALREAVDAAAAGGPALERARALVNDIALMSSISIGSATVADDTFDPRVPLRDAMKAVAAAAPDVHLIAEEPIHALPAVRSDVEKVAVVLARLLARALVVPESGAAEVRATVGAAGGRVEYRVPGVSADDHNWRFSVAVCGLLGATLDTETGAAGEVVVLSLTAASMDKTEAKQS